MTDMLSEKLRKRKSKSYHLIDEIINLSHENEWVKAKLEWDWINLYEQKPPTSCLCGHFPIINVCVLKNKMNNNTAEVGSCCVQKFMDNDVPARIFSSINKVKKDLVKSLNHYVITYCKFKNIINDWEYEFYSSICSKRMLSQKQFVQKININAKCIATITKSTAFISASIEKAKV